MPIRTQVILNPETLSAIGWAAEQRFRDAERLLSTGRFAGSVYLFGYAAEMWLKAICLRLRGLGPAAPVRPALAPAGRWLEVEFRRLALTPIPHESFHSLQFWVEMLIRLRITGANALPRELAGQLHHHVIQRLHQDWTVDLRCSRVIVDEIQARRVYNDCSWLNASRESLWR